MSFEPVTIFTFVLAVVAVLQFLTLRDTHGASLAVQRAYVDMSHMGTGMTLNLDQPNPNIDVKIAVKNSGKSPAEVLDFHLTTWVGEGNLPDEPPYSDHPPAGECFLMAGERFTVPVLLPLGPEEVQAIHHGHSIWLVGYVEYRDIFGRTHRGGYARQYQATLTQNNLVFALKPGYNYDKQLNKGPSWA